MDRWIPAPAALTRLFAGLVLFGAGEALVVASELGNSPWTVFAEGVAHQSGLSIGIASVLVSGLVLLAWIPLRQRPGFGTVANAVVIGLVIDAVLALMGPVEGTAGRVSCLVAGIGLVALGSGFYLGAVLGPGPRDGLMTGIHRMTGWPVGSVRNGIEVTVAIAGFALGGTLGLGTLTFALAIGPAVALSLRTLSPAVTAERRLTNPYGRQLDARRVRSALRAAAPRACAPSRAPSRRAAPRSFAARRPR